MQSIWFESKFGQILLISSWNFFSTPSNYVRTLYFILSHGPVQYEDFFKVNFVSTFFTLRILLTSCLPETSHLFENCSHKNFSFFTNCLPIIVLPSPSTHFLRTLRVFLDLLGVKNLIRLKELFILMIKFKEALIWLT